jgi:hypothetical protein
VHADDPERLRLTLTEPDVDPERERCTGDDEAVDEER